LAPHIVKSWGLALSSIIREIRSGAGLSNREIADGINGWLRLNGREERALFTAADVACDLARPRIGRHRSRQLVFGTLCALFRRQKTVAATLLSQLDDEGDEIGAPGIVDLWCEWAVRKADALAAGTQSAKTHD
jgi:hypothetical protein